MLIMPPKNAPKDRTTFIVGSKSDQHQPAAGKRNDSTTRAIANRVCAEWFMRSNVEATGARPMTVAELRRSRASGGLPG